MVYSTYLGGNDDDQAFSLAINSTGNVFITGSTSSRNFPGIQNSSLGGPSDGFVTQLNARGNEIVYSRYLGGSDEDECSSIVVDSSSNAYITGDTFSSNFPLLMPIQSTLSGGEDAFLTKLTPNGSMLYSTYFGGSSNDGGIDVAVDGDNNAYLIGTTSSANLLTKGVLQRNLAGGVDTFISKFDPTGTNLVYSTYLGGKLDDIASAINVDSIGNAYVTGATFSTDFPVTKPVQDKNKGISDVFVSVLDSTGSNFVYSTYLGGKAQDASLAMAIDKDGTVYLTGSSISSDFPTTNAFQRVSGGNSDAFLVKITNDVAPPAPDFSLTITPNTQTISPGNATSFTINSRAINGFNQPISLSVTSIPANSGLTTSFSNSTIMAGTSTTLTVSAASTLSPSVFSIAITATASQIVRTLTATVNITAPDFSISVEPNSQIVVVGNKASFTIKTRAINGFNQPIILAATTSPNDTSLTSSFSSDTINPDGSTTLTINTSANTPLNTFTITIAGLANQLVRTTTATLTTVSTAPTPDFSLNINPNQLMVTRKQSGTFNNANCS
ncbi:MAG: beta-propeller repeat-containing protein [bacterium]|nr:MAG: beta-propeller repeat-containing protein [bacterium]